MTELRRFFLEVISPLLACLGLLLLAAWIMERICVPVI